MTTLRITKDQREEIYAFARASDADVQAIVAALNASDFQVAGPEMASKAAASIADMEVDDAESLIDSLVRMYFPLIAGNRPVDQFIEDLVASLAQSEDDSGLDDDELAQLKVRLASAMRIDKVLLAVKATSLVWESERAFSDARIVTDVRPIFHLETDEIGASLIVHNLRLGYTERGSNGKEFYLSMTSSDMDELIAQLQRAKAKSMKLRALLTTSNVPLIDSDSL